MFEIFVGDTFSAAHRLRGYRGNCEKVHGHNWQVKAKVEAERLDKIGLGIDFRLLKKYLAKVLRGLDHQDLNKLKTFRRLNPSAENIAQFIYRQLKKKVNRKGVRLSQVEVCETPGSGAVYREN